MHITEAAFLCLCVSCGRNDFTYDSVVLRRSECFGPCPVYTITISNQGVVNFVGRSNVSVKTAGSTLSPERLRALSLHLAETDVANLAYISGARHGDCGASATDQPSVDISISAPTGDKSFHLYYGCQESKYKTTVANLAQAIDDLVDSSQWVDGKK
jgi:Domain of unknown function (DUF6438)